MFRIVVFLGCAALAWIAYDTYGYRLILNQIHQNADPKMTMGKRNASINIVAYIDYDSAETRQLFPSLLKILSNNPNTKLILRPIPTDTQTSKLAARIALASKQHNKFLDVSSLFLSSNANFDERYIELAVNSVGLNYNSIKATALSADIEKQLFDYQTEAKILSVTKTPYLFVGPVRMTQGSYSTAEIQKIIDSIK